MESVSGMPIMAGRMVPSSAKPAGVSQALSAPESVSQPSPRIPWYLSSYRGTVLLGVPAEDSIDIRAAWAPWSAVGTMPRSRMRLATRKEARW